MPGILPFTRFIQHRILITLVLLVVSGCAAESVHHAPATNEPSCSIPEQAPQKNQETDAGNGPVDQQIAAGDVVVSPSNAGDSTGAREGGRDRCYSLRPGKKIPCTKIVKGKNGKKKKVLATTTSRCQPQSLIYARCRTGIDTCRLGDTSPVQWFACARKNNATISTPQAGSVIILAANKRHCMPTGHPAYVEEVCPNGDGTWTLRLSHTNYDRKCHLDQDAQVVFSPKTMRVRFVTGPWSTWAKDLKVLGFITG